MFPKRIAARFLLLWAMIIPLSVHGQDLTRSEEESVKNLEVVLNKVQELGESGIQSRHIFLLITEEEFNPSNVEKIFDSYRKTYDKPVLLRISLYSSKEMLERLVNFEKQPITIEFSNDREGLIASQKFYERYYPLPKGYFRAEYQRNGKYESYSYSPRKEDTEMIRVSLKD